MKVEIMNGAMLAFVGDAYYELKVRQMLMERSINKPKKFHQLAVFYVCAKAQAKVLQQLIEADYLTETELSVVRRGRNVNSGTVPKHTVVRIYRQSTAFEALIGYLYLNEDFQRLNEVISHCIELRRKDEENE